MYSSVFSVEKHNTIQPGIPSRIIFSACAICGVLCISLPIPIIVNNFNKFYEKAKIEEEITAKKKKSSWDELRKDTDQPEVNGVENGRRQFAGQECFNFSLSLSS